MAPQASKQGGLLPPDHHRLASCTSNGINSEQIPGIIFMPPQRENYTDDYAVKTFRSHTEISSHSIWLNQRDRGESSLYRIALSQDGSWPVSNFFAWWQWWWWWILLWILLLLLAIYWWKIPQSDEIRFTNGGTDTKAVLIDGTLATDLKFKNDAKASPSPDTTASSLIIGDYNNKVIEDIEYTIHNPPEPDHYAPLPHRGAAIVFADNRPPLTVTDVDWKDDSTTIDVTLPDPIEVPIKIWIVNADGLSFSDIQTQADAAVVQANLIYAKERQGLTVSASFENKTAHARANEFSAFTCSLANPNNTPNIQTVIGHQPGMINVYYVAAVDLNEGVTGILSTNGVWCGGVSAFDVIAIGIEASDDLLVHELGHAFSLGHVGNSSWAMDFNKRNVMHEAPDCVQDVNHKWDCGRTYLTEGQTYRQVINGSPDVSTPGSALNDPAIYNRIPPFTPPFTPPFRYCGHFSQRDLVVDGAMPQGWINQPFKSECPVVEKRIWAD